MLWSSFRPRMIISQCSLTHRAATRAPDRTRVARAPPRTRRGPRLCGAAPPPSASCSGNTGPRSTSKPNAARAGRPRRRTGGAGPGRSTTASARRRPGPGSRTNTRTTTCKYRERRRRASRDERTQRRADAAHEAWNATRHARHRSALRLLVYENAARAVGLDLSRRLSKAPYSPSLEQLVAEADRQVARESRKPDRHQSRPEAAPMTPTTPAVRPARPHPATDAPSTGYDVDSSGTWSPPGPRRTSSPPLTFRCPQPR